MSPKVYIETSVISYLTARPARDIVVLAHQQLTRDWWATERNGYDLYASEIVIAEAERGDAEAARARLEMLREMKQLAANIAAEQLVPILLRDTGLPRKALADMAHIALATVHGMQFLLTWNCKHIANANVLRRVAKTCRLHGYDVPVICTPEELMGSRYVE
ncbi:MAG: type II toxin-antitoxin system VapC family toxin [Thermoanaerobaculia bacterium]